jgi:DNA polymerase-1
VKGRDATKTFWYAYLYGGGDEKLGSILFPTLSRAKQAKRGKEFRARFENALPALGLLVRDLKNAGRRGYLKGIDGRRIYVRSEHSILNFRLQSTAAILSRYWNVGFAEGMEEEFGPQGWTGQWAGLGWIHDEIQAAVRPEIAERSKVLAVHHIEVLTDRFNLRCPITGKAVLGANWKETH